MVKARDLQNSNEVELARVLDTYRVSISCYILLATQICKILILFIETII